MNYNGVAMALAALSFVACFDVGGPAMVGATIAGLVSDPNGAPLSGVSVRIVTVPEFNSNCVPSDLAAEFAKTNTVGVYSTLIQESDRTPRRYCVAIRYLPPQGSGLVSKDTVLSSVILGDLSNPPSYDVDVMVKKAN